MREKNRGGMQQLTEQNKKKRTCCILVQFVVSLYASLSSTRYKENFIYTRILSACSSVQKNNRKKKKERIVSNRKSLIYLITLFCSSTASNKPFYCIVFRIICTQRTICCSSLIQINVRDSI